MVMVDAWRRRTSSGRGSASAKKPQDEPGGRANTTTKWLRRSAKARSRRAALSTPNRLSPAGSAPDGVIHESHTLPAQPTRPR